MSTRVALRVHDAKCLTLTSPTAFSGWLVAPMTINTISLPSPTIIPCPQMTDGDWLRARTPSRKLFFLPFSAISYVRVSLVHCIRDAA